MLNANVFNVRKRTLNGVLTAWVLLKKYPDAVIHEFELWEIPTPSTIDFTTNEHYLLSEVRHLGFIAVWQHLFGCCDAMPLLLKHIDDAVAVRKNIEFKEAILEYVIHPNQLDILSGNVLTNVKTFNILLRTWHYREHISIQIGSVLFGEKCRQVDEAVSLAYSKIVNYNNVEIPCNVAIVSHRHAALVSPRILDVTTAVKYSGVCISPFINGTFVLTVTMASHGISFIFLQFLKTIATVLDSDSKTFLITRENVQYFL